MSETVTITGITGHDAGMTGHIDRNRCRIPESGCGDDARRPGQLPGQPKHQGLQLLLADLQMGLIAGRPSEQTLVETRAASQMPTPSCTRTLSRLARRLAKT